MATTNNVGIVRLAESWRFVMCLVIYFSVASAGTVVAQSLERPVLEHDSSSRPSVNSRLLLGPGDLLDVQVFNTPELSAKIRVSQNGSITLPVGGEVEVAKLSPKEAAAAVEDKLRAGLVMSDPRVNVFVNEYATQGVTVLGEVRNPGTFTLLGEHSLYRAISAAGGTSSFAGASITISHPDDAAHPLIIPVRSPNYSELVRSTSIEPGDIVVVSKADLIYVVGDVAHPGAYFEENGEPVSVLNALALAAGLNHTASASRASIVRKAPHGAITIRLNLNRIMSNKDKNVMLEASDILVIPRSGAKVLLETALPGATAAVTGAVTTALVIR